MCHHRTDPISRVRQSRAGPLRTAWLGFAIHVAVLATLFGCGPVADDSPDSDDHQNGNGSEVSSRNGDDEPSEPENENIARLRRIEAELNREGHLHSLCHEALELVEQTLKEDPNVAVAYAVRADVHMQHREYKKAIDDYDKAFDLERNNVVYGRKLAVSYEADGQFDKALNVWKGLCRRFPKDGDNFWGRASVYEKLGREEAAQADYEKANRLMGIQ